MAPVDVAAISSALHPRLILADVAAPTTVRQGRKGAREGREASYPPS
jgi:hypothetical protein